jgi:hypothetical protein
MAKDYVAKRHHERAAKDARIAELEARENNIRSALLTLLEHIDDGTTDSTDSNGVRYQSQSFAAAHRHARGVVDTD